MQILVTGGTGSVGSQVVQALASRGAQVAVLTRDRKKTAALPDGVNVVEGDLLKPASVRSVFNGVDAVFLLNAVSQTESHEALLALTGMQIAKVKRLVYMSVHSADKAAWLPHFGSKVGVEEAIKVSGIAYTILRPNHFFQNDYWSKDVLLQHGVYPQPIGEVGTSRVDVRDIAEAAAVALTTAGHQGQTYDLVGPEVLTGPAIAAAWSKALGRPIKYGGNDLEAWEQQALTYLPNWMAFDFKLMYQHFQAHGLRASAEAIARQTALLGNSARPFEAFASETARTWSP